MVSRFKGLGGLGHPTGKSRNAMLCLARVCSNRVYSYINMFRFEEKSHILLFQLQGEDLDEYIYGAFDVQRNANNHRSKSSKLVETRLRDSFLFLGMKVNGETNALCVQKGVYRRFEGLCLKKNFLSASPQTPQFLANLLTE